MSCKIPMNNGINCADPQWIKANNLVDTTVKLAGEEAKDRLYEPKHKKKLVRVLTVIAYVFFVSLAAIMLSLYYVFLWNGGQKNLPKIAVQRENHAKCNDILAEVAEMQKQIASLEERNMFSAVTPTTEENTTTLPSYDIISNGDVGQTSTFIKKLQYQYPYAEND